MEYPKCCFISNRAASRCLCPTSSRAVGHSCKKPQLFHRWKTGHKGPLHVIRQGKIQYCVQTEDKQANKHFLSKFLLTKKMLFVALPRMHWNGKKTLQRMCRRWERKAFLEISVKTSTPPTKSSDQSCS